MFSVYTYAAYLVASVVLTVWVARTLHRNGRVFLVDAFKGNEPLADSVNHLLVVGFYLVNLGFVTLALKYGETPIDTQTAIEAFSTRIGRAMLLLGVMHFFNIYVFNYLRSAGRELASFAVLQEDTAAQPESVEALRNVKERMS